MRMADDEQDIDETTTTILAVRIPQELRERIKDAARREDRTESSFARFYLGRAADMAIEAAKPMETA